MKVLEAELEEGQKRVNKKLKLETDNLTAHLKMYIEPEGGGKDSEKTKT